MKLKMIQINEDTHYEIKKSAIDKKMSIKQYIEYIQLFYIVNKEKLEK